jgi:hypothetical protein
MITLICILLFALGWTIVAYHVLKKIDTQHQAELQRRYNNQRYAWRLAQVRAKRLRHA